MKNKRCFGGINRESRVTLADVIKRYGYWSEDAIFSLLLICGVNKSRAYDIVFRPNATSQSVNAMACRKSKEIAVQKYLNEMYNSWEFDNIKPYNFQRSVHPCTLPNKIKKQSQPKQL